MPTEPDVSQNVGAEVLPIMPSSPFLLPRPSSFNLSPAPEPPTGSERAHTVGPQGKRGPGRQDQGRGTLDSRQSA